MDQAQLAADGADFRVVEVAHETADGIGLQQRVRVGEDEDVAARLRDAVADDRELAAALVEAQQPDALALEPADDRVGSVAGAIRADEDLQALARIVHREAVPQRALDYFLFVVRGEEEAHARQPLAAAPAFGAGDQVIRVAPHLDDGGEQKEQERIAEVGIERQADPENRDPQGRVTHYSVSLRFTCFTATVFACGTTASLARGSRPYR